MLCLLLMVGFFITSCSPSQADKNQEAIKLRVDAYMTSPENMLDLSDYKGLVYSEVDTLEGFENGGNQAFKITLRYEGRNTASRLVQREAEVFFNKSFEVVTVSTTRYFDPMTKDEYKDLGKN